MGALTGTQIKATYGDVLQLGNAGAGVTASVLNVVDGLGNATAFSMSTGIVRATGTLSVVQTGGVVGTNELQLTNDGTSNYIVSKQSGVSIIVDMPADGTIFRLRRSDAITSYLNIIAEDGGLGSRLQPTVSGSSGVMRIDCTKLRLYASGTTLASITPVANTPVMAATDGTTDGWFQNTGGEAALTANFTEAVGVLTATNLSRSVVAGRSYRLIAFLQVSNSTAAEGVQLDFNGGSATATAFFAAASAIGSVVAGTVVSTALNGVINYTTVTGTDYIVIHGYLKVNAAGTFTLRAAENTSATGTMTLGAGSWMALMDTKTL